jgi:arylsulfatase A-like enzyme
MENKFYSRRDFLKNAGLATAAYSLYPSALLQQNNDQKPNILFIMTDDHGYQSISCYGSIINKTPNIDRLAKDGIKFTRSFCTNSICGPSRAVLLTGKYSHMNGFLDNSNVFDGSQVTVPKLLQKAGYETAIFGKWHLKSDPTGFDYWNILPGQGIYYNPDFIEMGVRKKREGYVTDIITDDCIKWMSDRKSEKPFCAYLHHKAPHRNWMPDSKHLDLYKDTDIPIPETFNDDYNTRSKAARQQKMRIADDLTMASDLKIPPDNTPEDDSIIEANDREMWKYSYEKMNAEQRKAWDAAYKPVIDEFHKTNPKGEKLNEWKYQRYIKDYLRCIASVDDNIGKVLDFLDQKKLTKNTIVIYTSDQGFYLGEHGWFDKRFMYEESLRMPLIIRYPKEIPPKTDEKSMVMNLDFAPTFLDYAGAKIPEEMQGKSLRNILAGKPPGDWRKSVYYHYFEYPAEHSVKRHYGIRTEKYKLIHFYFDIDEWELFDLDNDPHELKNIYSEPGNKDIIAELKTELIKLQKQYKDTEYEKYIPKNEILTVKHKGVGCNVNFKYPFSQKYPGGSSNALTDGIRSPKYITKPDYKIWQGFEETDLDAIIDLKEITSIQKIAAGFMQNQESWIFLPKEVIFELSSDGVQYERVAFISQDLSTKWGEISRVEFSKKFKTTNARFIHVIAKNIAICPEWHTGSGGKAWIFADEIIIE